jgi:DNA mismatch repair protein MutS2
VAAAGPGTLVLLDELGAGTDPTEGSALAQALLDHFIRAGSLVAATTHYAELKAYAHTTPAARNASVEFDLDTLSPTYRLTIGLPGGSQAFEIAQRLGLSQAIVTDARSRLSESQRSFEATLASIKEAEGETSDRLEQARLAEQRTAEALRLAHEERRAARREREELVRAARSEAELLVAGLHEEVQATRRTLERETVTGRVLDAAIARADAELARLPEPEPAAPEPAPLEPRTWQLGELARSRSGGWEGRVTGLDRGGRRATLESGAMRVSTSVDDLELIEAAPAAAPPEETLAAVWPAGPSRANPVELSRSRRSRPAAPAAPENSPTTALRLDRMRTVASSLDLRGARVEEALELLGRYLDDASLAGLERVTIVHGIGTGALRDAVRTVAAAHPLVEAIRPGARGEGGDGATLISL